MSNSSFLSLLSSGSLSTLTAQVAEHHKALTAIPELVKVSGSDYKITRRSIVSVLHGERASQLCFGSVVAMIVV